MRAITVLLLLSASLILAAASYETGDALIGAGVQRPQVLLFWE
jgi:hypothetical protein